MSLNRREFLQIGAVTSATLTTVSLSATLSGCSQPIALADGFKVFRAKDIAIFAKVASVALNLEDSGVVQRLVLQIDNFLVHTSLDGNDKLKQLLDLLDFAPTRLLTTGWTHDWASASKAEVLALLEKWRASSFELLRLSYTSLVSISSMVFYMQPENFAASGYPGPPQHEVSLIEGQK